MMTCDPTRNEHDLIADIMAAFAACFPDAQVSADSDFFDLGGDSLKAQSLCLLLQDICGAEVHPAVLFTHSTPATIAPTLVAKSGCR